MVLPVIFLLDGLGNAIFCAVTDKLLNSSTSSIRPSLTRSCPTTTKVAVEINTVKPGQVIEFQPYLHACRYPVGHRLLTVTLSYSSSVFTSLVATTFVRSLIQKKISIGSKNYVFSSSQSLLFFLTKI